MGLFAHTLALLESAQSNFPKDLFAHIWAVITLPICDGALFVSVFTVRQLRSNKETKLPVL